MTHRIVTKPNQLPKVYSNLWCWLWEDIYSNDKDECC